MSAVASPPSFEDVLAADQRIQPVARTTPILSHPALDEAAGASVFVKAECLQTTGSFKIRGAMNRLSQIPEGARAAGVVAFSSGNHAQGVARAARLLDMPALIVMPSDAPRVKTDGVLADGAQIHAYDRANESREGIAASIAAERGAVLAPSFDDPAIIAGQGTVGVELARQMEAHGGSLDDFICCAGGGGLIAGMSLALEQLSPETRVWSAEPNGFDGHRRSLEAGERVSVDPGAHSICDAVLTPMPGEITFQATRRLVSGGFAVSDAEVAEAIRFAFRHLKIVVEPGGAVALAAAIRGLPGHMRGRRVGVVASGGNVDPQLFADILSGLI